MLLLACSATESPDPVPGGPPLAANQSVTAPAIIRYNPIEGGCWLLELAGHGRYQPVTLPPAFHQDGAEVAVTVRGAPGYAGICMAGPFVFVDSIALR